MTQIDDYTKRVKRMVGKVHLQRHHPLRARHLRPGGRRSRRLLRSSRAERRRYLAEGQRGGATTRRAAAAVPPAPRCLPNAARRGGGLFAHAEACGFGHRSRHRIRSAARSKSGCSHAPAAAANAAGRAVAWQTPHQRALEVDPIVPKNHDGSDDLGNMQAFCFSCNAGKRWEARGGLWVLRAGGQQAGADQALCM